jgi:hypothetical protein
MSCLCRASQSALQVAAQTDGTPAKASATATSCAHGSTDRYVSFQGIDCEGNTRRVMALIDRYTLGGEPVDAFWTYFHKRRAATLGPRFDDLLLLSSFVNPVRELFEAKDDAEGLALLEKLEDECF